MESTANCRVCGGQVAGFGRLVLLGRHAVDYSRCTACGYVQTVPPYWLDEAYSSAIAEQDVGLVSRNLRYARLTDRVISCFLNPHGVFRD